MKLLSALLAVLLVCAASPALAAHEGVTLPALLTRTTTYSILVDLLSFSGLTEIVSEALNITIFAPTNFAFRATAIELACADVSTNDAVAACYKALGAPTVATVLQYHVVPSLLASPDVLATTTFVTLLGQAFTRRGTRFIDASPQFTNPMLFPAQLDLRYQYGYVHGISRVLMPVLPSGAPTIVQVLKDAGAFNVLFALVAYADIASELSALNDVTIFAPTDRAFALTAQQLGCKTTASNAAVIACFTGSFTPTQVGFGLRYHITTGVLATPDVLKAKMLLMANGAFLYQQQGRLVDQEPLVTNAVLAARLQDVRFDKGIVHAITRALIPFRDLVEVTQVCKTFEFPISLADTSFLPLFKIIQAARKCAPFRRAVATCELMEKEICKNYRGEKFVGFGLSVGRIVAASKKCLDVAAALRACPQTQ